MPHRLVFAALMPTDVAERARREFDAIIVEGSNDMTVQEVVEAANRIQAQGILFTNTLPLTAEAIRQLPPSIRVGATSMWS